MSNAHLDAELKIGAWQVPATFANRDSPDSPLWEQAFADFLRESRTRTELQDLFARFSAGENAFDALMRRIILKSLCKSVGKNLQVGRHVTLMHPETMEFGDSVLIGAHTIIQGRFDGVCKFGNHVWIGPQSYLDARRLVVEDYVGWGPGAKVLGSTHTGLPLDKPIITTDLIMKSVTVCHGADVGMNASILPGVRVGAHSIIGAGAVVTRDVPEFAIVAGVPARLVRDRRLVGENGTGVPSVEEL